MGACSFGFAGLGCIVGSTSTKYEGGRSPFSSFKLSDVELLRNFCGILSKWVLTLGVGTVWPFLLPPLSLSTFFFFANLVGLGLGV